MGKYFAPVKVDGTTILDPATGIEVDTQAVAQAIADGSIITESGGNLIIAEAGGGSLGLVRYSTNSYVQSNPTNSAHTVNIGTARYLKGACKAWAVFDTTSGVPSILNSYNVSSITKVNAGDYRATFSTAMDSANYTVAGGVGHETSDALFFTPYYQEAATTTTIRMGMRNHAMSSYDPKRFCFAVFGGLS